ncbi:hypothetical protein NAF17_06595 [Mucilaginibacter sp. RB4R14]|nr:hypothetical protein [Mucilaginibacter aurantiaciroseus]MCO5935202.1 hypothetical protein [Mucilaginibacter aurantiaciroseus]
MRKKSTEKKGDVFEDLTTLEQKSRKVAIAFAFVSVFVWAVKILFF